jgi:hypothetical protein
LSDDFTKRRIEKDLEAARKVPAPAGTAPAAEYTEEVVRLIACVNCHSPAFSLAHDGRVMCAVCRTCIVSLRWFDQNVTPTPA